MSIPDKTTLLAKLDQHRAAAQQRLEGIDYETVVHPDSGWTARDLIGHISAWELEGVLALEAFLSGQTYSIPGYVQGGTDAYNARQQQRRAGHSIEQILAEWAEVRERFKAALQSIPDEQWLDPMTVPWGADWGVEQQPPVQVARGLSLHEKEHIDEIVQACT